MVMHSLLAVLTGVFVCDQCDTSALYHKRWMLQAKRHK